MKEAFDCTGSSHSEATRMKRQVLKIVVWIILLAGCSKGGDIPGGGGTNNPSPPAVLPPTSSTLLRPLNNTACLSGISVDANNSKITFSWQAASNTETYNLVVKNLVSAEQHTYTVSDTTQDLVLSKGQPYSWYVVSKSSKTTTTAQSEVWKFYEAGNPTSSYAPFPAKVVAPADNAIIASGGASQVNVLLQWNATDIDNDIISYTVYLDVKDASTKISSSSAVNASLSLSSGKTYYWRVETTDSAGNSSDSGANTFTIQ